MSIFPCQLIYAYMLYPLGIAFFVFHSLGFILQYWNFERLQNIRLVFIAGEKNCSMDTDDGNI